MALSLVTAPADEPVTLAEVKRHCRIEATDEHDLLNGLIETARLEVENLTHRALISQTWDWSFDAFPCSDESIWIPLAPLVSVTSVTYYDAAGDQQTWSSSDYAVDAPAGPFARQGRIFPNYGERYPTTQSITNAVTVRFVAGYGDPEDVPAMLKAAIKIRVLDLWETARSSVVVGNIVTSVPRGFDALVWPFKAF